MGMAETSFLWPLGVVLVNLGLDGGAFLVFLGSAVPGAVSPPAFLSPGWFHLGFSFFSFPYSETRWEASSEARERPSSLWTDGRFNLARSISSRNIRQAHLSLCQLLELVLGHGLVVLAGCGIRVVSAISPGGGTGLLRWSSQKQAKTIERI
jgi:hypothetical protein